MRGFTLKAAALSILAALLASVPAGAQTTGMIAPHTDTFDAWRTAGASGSAQDQFKVAIAYLTGSGTARDLAQGEAWLRVAREQGFGPAEHLAGLRLLARKGQAKKAFPAMIAASEAGVAAAQAQVGLMRLYGFGATAETSRALVHLAGAARAGDPEAAFALSRVYLFERGAPRNSDLGRFWLEAAAKRGHPSAQLLLARLLARGTFRGEAPHAPLKWALLAAWGGHPSAMALAEEQTRTLKRKDVELARAEASLFRPLEGAMDQEVAGL